MYTLLMLSTTSTTCSTGQIDPRTVDSGSACSMPCAWLKYNSCVVPRNESDRLRLVLVAQVIHVVLRSCLLASPAFLTEEPPSAQAILFEVRRSSSSQHAVHSFASRPTGGCATQTSITIRCSDACKHL
eukprot:jgi/Ulvmu1/5070/UM021_0087.1